MTADTEIETTGQSQNTASRRRSGAGKKQKPRGAAATRRSRARVAAGSSPSASASGAGKASTKRARRIRTARGSAKAKRRSSSAEASAGGLASRLLTRGRRAAGNAYEWAAEGASRAMPLSSSSSSDQRLVQRFVDERPYMLGALGLGLGAMIGLMLPGRLSAIGTGSRGRSRR